MSWCIAVMLRSIFKIRCNGKAISLMIWTSVKYWQYISTMKGLRYFKPFWTDYWMLSIGIQTHGRWYYSSYEWFFTVSYCVMKTDYWPQNQQYPTAVLLQVVDSTLWPVMRNTHWFKWSVTYIKLHIEYLHFPRKYKTHHSIKKGSKSLTYNVFKRHTHQQFEHFLIVVFPQCYRVY